MEVELIGEWSAEMLPVSNMIQAVLAQRFEKMSLHEEAKILETTVWEPVAPGQWLIPEPRSPKPKKDGMFIWVNGSWSYVMWHSFYFEKKLHVLTDLRTGSAMGLYGLVHSVAKAAAEKRGEAKPEAAACIAALKVLVSGQAAGVWPPALGAVIRFAYEMVERTKGA